MKVEIDKKEAVWMKNRLYDFANWIGVSADCKRRLFQHIRKLEREIKKATHEQRIDTKEQENLVCIEA